MFLWFDSHMFRGMPCESRCHYGSFPIEVRFRRDQLILRKVETQMMRSANRRLNTLGLSQLIWAINSIYTVKCINKQLNVVKSKTFALQAHMPPEFVYLWLDCESEIIQLFYNVNIIQICLSQNVRIQQYTETYFLSSFTMHVEMGVLRVWHFSLHNFMLIYFPSKYCAVLIRNSCSFHLLHCLLGSRYCLSAIACSQLPPVFNDILGWLWTAVGCRHANNIAKSDLNQQLISNLESKQIYTDNSFMHIYFLAKYHIWNWSLLPLPCKHCVMWDYFLHLQNRPFEHVKNAPDNIFSKYSIHKSETSHPMFLNCFDMDIGNCIKTWWSHDDIFLKEKRTSFKFTRAM